MSEPNIQARAPVTDGKPGARGLEQDPAGGEGPSRFCPTCYAINAWSRVTCERCGAPLETTRDFDAGLIWALDHPDTATAMLAARVLAERRQEQAIEPLARLARSQADPYRAAAAVRALRAFAGNATADACVEEARRHPSVIVRRAATDGAAAGPVGVGSVGDAR